MGLAFEVHDSYVTRKKAEKEKEDDQLRLESRYKTVQPGVMDMFFYSSCYIGLLTGQRGWEGFNSLAPGRFQFNLST